jgi:hypothetical protein
MTKGRSQNSAGGVTHREQWLGGGAPVDGARCLQPSEVLLTEGLLQDLCMRGFDR